MMQAANYKKSTLSSLYKKSTISMSSKKHFESLIKSEMVQEYTSLVHDS